MSISTSAHCVCILSVLSLQPSVLVSMEETAQAILNLASFSVSAQMASMAQFANRLSVSAELYNYVFACTACNIMLNKGTTMYIAYINSLYMTYSSFLNYIVYAVCHCR